MTLVRCPGCSDRKHHYNPDDPFSVGFIDGFHRYHQISYVGKAAQEEYLIGVNSGIKASSGLLVQGSLF